MLAKLQPKVSCGWTIEKDECPYASYFSYLAKFLVDYILIYMHNTLMDRLCSDKVETATYDTGHSLRGFSPLTYNGTLKQPDLTVNAVALEGNQTIHMWTVINPQSANATASVGSATYKVYARDGYQNLIFDHWKDSGSTNRIRTLTTDKPTTLIAYYRTG